MPPSAAMSVQMPLSAPQVVLHPQKLLQTHSTTLLASCHLMLLPWAVMHLSVARLDAQMEWLKADLHPCALEHK